MTTTAPFNTPHRPRRPASADAVGQLLPLRQVTAPPPARCDCGKMAGMTSDEPRDCSFDEDGMWFRHRACAVVLRDGCVLMARNEAEDYFYSVGGGVHHGESAIDAVRREVLEETGVALEVERLLFVHENLFTDSDSPSLAGRSCHELALYFLMRDDPALVAGDTGSTTLGGAREWTEWVPLDRYGVDRPAYPPFFATALADFPACPQLVTTGE